MEQVGSREEILADVRVKEERVQSFLARQHLDGLVIGRQDNFAWITAGGDSRVVTTSEMGFAYLVIAPDRKYLVSHSMDGQRFIDEQVPDQGYELVTLYWHQGSPVDKVLEMTPGMRLAADFSLPGAAQAGRDLVDLHYPLTDLDLRRCRWLGQATDRVLFEVAANLRPGMTEREIAAQLLSECALLGITLDVLIVGADERISRYRHPLPTDNPLRRYALLHPAARRWGLHANVTRLVHFGEPPAHLQRAIDGVLTIAGHVAILLAPGVRFADILQEQVRLYALLSYPEEWNYHFQGGITGYVLADPARCLDPQAHVVQRQAYDYFVTITGAKCEELTLLTEDGVSVASLGSGWPARRVETPRGDVVMPDVLIR